MADDARQAELRGLMTAVMVELLDDHGLFDMGLESEDAADALVPVVSAWAEQRAAVELEAAAQRLARVGAFGAACVVRDHAAGLTSATEEER